MEIVKNGELLESQIIEDARARARRILDAADKESAAIRAAGEARLGEEKRTLESAMETKLKTLRTELASSLPLDFKRTRLAFQQESLDRAIADYFGGLPGPALGRTIARELSSAAFAFPDAKLVVWCAGMEFPEARRIAEESLPGTTVTDVRPLPAAAAAAAGTGVIVETSDGSRRFRATLGELTAHLLEEYREQLVTALFGEMTTP